MFGYRLDLLITINPVVRTFTSISLHVESQMLFSQKRQMPRGISNLLDAALQALDSDIQAFSDMDGHTERLSVKRKLTSVVTGMREQGYESSELWFNEDTLGPPIAMWRFLALRESLGRYHAWANDRFDVWPSGVWPSRGDAQIGIIEEYIRKDGETIFVLGSGHTSDGHYLMRSREYEDSIRKELMRRRVSGRWHYQPKKGTNLVRISWTHPWNLVDHLADISQDIEISFPFLEVELPAPISATCWVTPNSAAKYCQERLSDIRRRANTLQEKTDQLVGELRRELDPLNACAASLEGLVRQHKQKSE